MAKKIIGSKKPKKETEFHSEVVLLDDVADVLIKNFFHSMDILRDASFCDACNKNKTE